MVDPATLRQQVIAAVDSAVKADRQNAAKWSPLYAVFKNELGVPPGDGGVAAKLITQEKQVSNRIRKELSDQRPRYIVLSILDDVTLEYLRPHLDVAKFPGAALVLVFKGKEPRQVLRAARDTVVDALLEAFKDISPEQWSPNGGEDSAKGPAPLVFREPASAPTPLELSQRPPVPPSKRSPNALVGLDEAFKAAVSALRADRHVILFGPPGTGKTELAEWLCQQLLVDGSRFAFSTATSDWTTFDTIGGYVPDPELSGQLDFSSGIVTRTLEAGQWLIIDELNRADIDKAFGELFTLLSGKHVRLPYKRLVYRKMMPVILGPAKDPDATVVPIPEGWRMLGTMNSFDKANLFQLSYAFMRRFAFVHVPVPEESEYAALLKNRCASRKLSKRVTDSLVKLFTSDQGLPGIGLSVGPAIPLDVIRFAAESDVSEPEELMIALEAFLLPQFEGQDKKHGDIAARIAEVIGYREQDVASKLAIWTGYEPA